MKYIRLYLLLLVVMLLHSCDLQKDVEVDLPVYAPQLVVECYLEAGKPYRLTVLESSSYFETPQPIVVDDAEAYVTYKGIRTQIPYKPTFDENTGRLYTHVAEIVMKGKPGDVYTLEVTDPKGRIVTGSTTILPKVKIDTIEWKFNEKEEAYLLTSFHDDASTTNYYRYMVHQDSLQTDANQNFTSSDRLTNGQRISFGSSYEYARGDKALVTLFNIEKQYFDFLNSTADARSANGNPFAQPSQIISSLQGGIGIFTNLAYTRKVVVIQ